MTTTNMLETDSVRLFVKVSVPAQLRARFSLKQAQRCVLEYFESKGMKGTIAKGMPAVYVDGNAASVKAATQSEVLIEDKGTNTFVNEITDHYWRPDFAISLAPTPVIDDKVVSQLVEVIELEQSPTLLVAIGKRAIQELRREALEKREKEAELKRQREAEEVEDLKRRLESATTEEEKEKIRFDAILLKLKRDIDRSGGIEAYANRLSDMYQGR